MTSVPQLGNFEKIIFSSAHDHELVLINLLSLPKVGSLRCLQSFQHYLNLDAIYRNVLCTF